MHFTYQQRRFLLRDMAAADLPLVLSIEQNGQKYPWSAANFESSIESSHQAQVLELDDVNSTTLAGFIVTSTAADEAELLNVAIAPDFQRQGLGKELLTKVCESFDESIRSLFLEVRASNHGAIALYDSLEFNEVGIRPNYYPAKQGRENAIIMAKEFA